LFLFLFGLERRSEICTSHPFVFFVSLYAEPNKLIVRTENILPMPSASDTIVDQKLDHRIFTVLRTLGQIFTNYAIPLTVFTGTVPHLLTNGRAYVAHFELWTCLVGKILASLAQTVSPTHLRLWVSVF
jgi:hypothetical protein